jgi:hypothetical protein
MDTGNDRVRVTCDNHEGDARKTAEFRRTEVGWILGEGVNRMTPHLGHDGFVTIGLQCRFKCGSPVVKIRSDRLAAILGKLDSAGVGTITLNGLSALLSGKFSKL